MLHAPIIWRFPATGNSCTSVVHFTLHAKRQAHGGERADHLELEQCEFLTGQGDARTTRRFALLTDAKRHIFPTSGARASEEALVEYKPHRRCLRCLSSTDADIVRCRAKQIDGGLR